MKKKILYTFYHGAAFAWALVHKLTQHPNDEAYLMVADGWDWCVGKPRLLLLLEFRDAGVFKEVYTYDNRLGRDAQEFDCLEKTEENILYEMDMRLKKQKCDITEFDKIYSHTDGEDTMGIYLAMKQLPFYWFENSPNMLSYRTRQWVEENYAGHIGYKEALLKYRTLFGGYEHQHYILYPNSRAETFPVERCEIFDIEAAARSLSDEAKQMILKCFDLEEVTCPSNAAMLLLQSNWLPDTVYNANEFVKERFKYKWFYMFYGIQCMLDYYVPEGAVPVLKTHPTIFIDEKTSEKYFGGAFAFHALFTVLLTKSLLTEYKPKYRLLLGSTANQQLSAESTDICCPGVWLFPLFYHKYYVVCDVLCKMGLLDKYAGERFENIGHPGTIMNYNTAYMTTDINNLINVNFKASEIRVEENYKVVQINITEWKEKLSEYDFIIYTDVWQKSTEEVFKYLEAECHVLKIRLGKLLHKNKADILAPLEDEYIYVLSKNEKYLEQLQGYRLEKENKYAGINLVASVENMSTVMQKQEPYAVGFNISLYECYQKFGRQYIDDAGNEINISGAITKRALDNMRAISVIFSGAGKNRVEFKDLDTPQKYAGSFKVEALNGCVITIGRIYFANSWVLVHAANAEVVIDDDVMFESNVVVKAMNYHSIYEFNGKRLPNRNLYIGKHVWLGYNTIIYAGSVIGEGSIIGEGSVVSGKIPNNCIAVGNPAKVVRKDVFWQWNGSPLDYYNLPEHMRMVDEYIARTEEERKVNEGSSSSSNEVK